VKAFYWLIVLVTLPPTTWADCWESAANKYQLPSTVLKAIAFVESSYNPNAHEELANSESLGIMQVNSFWFPELRQHGIEREDLWDPCTNIEVGAWILAQEKARLGWNWLAIGSYNVGGYTDNKKHKLPLYRKYAEKVYETLRQLEKQQKPNLNKVQNAMD